MNVELGASVDVVASVELDSGAVEGESVEELESLELPGPLEVESLDDASGEVGVESVDVGASVSSPKGICGISSSGNPTNGIEDVSGEVGVESVDVGASVWGIGGNSSPGNSTNGISTSSDS